MIRCPGCWVTKGDAVEGDITLTVSNGIDAASNGYDGAEKCPVLIEAALDDSHSALACLSFTDAVQLEMMLRWNVKDYETAETAKQTYNRSQIGAGITPPPGKKQLLEILQRPKKTAPQNRRNFHSAKIWIHGFWKTAGAASGDQKTQPCFKPVENMSIEVQQIGVGWFGGPRREGGPCVDGNVIFFSDKSQIVDVHLRLRTEQNLDFATFLESACAGALTADKKRFDCSGT